MKRRAWNEREMKLGLLVVRSGFFLTSEYLYNKKRESDSV